MWKKKGAGVLQEESRASVWDDIQKVIIGLLPGFNKDLVVWSLSIEAGKSPEPREAHIPVL